MMAKMKFIQIVFSFGFVSGIYAGTVQQIYIKDNKPAVKGGEIQIVCEITGFSNDDVVIVYKTDSQPPQSLTGLLSVTTCIPNVCLGRLDRHTFSTDSSKVTITVNNVNRAEDQKWWTYAISDQRKSMNLTVYTVTSTLEYDSRYSQDQDLVQNSVTWKCSTGCAYPAPLFTWYYSETSGSRQEWSTSETVTNKAGGCSDSERIYTSTLSLPRYTIFSDNTDKTVKFQCGAVSITGKTDEKFTPTTVNVQFAVQVASVTLKDGNTTPSGTLEVTSGVSKTLTCTSSVSRPTATVIWVIGNVEKKRSTDSTSTFTFTPTDSDHEKNLYCKAFNIQPEYQAVKSNEPTIFVKAEGQVNADFKYVDSCYSVGQTLSLEAVYTGSGTPSIVQWSYSEGTGPNVFVVTSTCTLFGSVPAGYPSTARMEYKCSTTDSLPTNTYRLTVTGLTSDELTKSWGATFTPQTGTGPVADEFPIPICEMTTLSPLSTTKTEEMTTLPAWNGSPSTIKNTDFIISVYIGLFLALSRITC